MAYNELANRTHRGTMQPRQKSDMEIFTDMQDQMKEAAKMIDYYMKKKITAEKVMQEIMENSYYGGRTDKAGKTEEGK